MCMDVCDVPTEAASVREGAPNDNLLPLWESALALPRATLQPCLLSRGEKRAVWRMGSNCVSVSAICCCCHRGFCWLCACLSVLCWVIRNGVYCLDGEYMLILCVSAMFSLSLSRHLISSGVSGLWSRPRSPPSTSTSWGMLPSWK